MNPMQGRTDQCKATGVKTKKNFSRGEYWIALLAYRAAMSKYQIFLLHRFNKDSVAVPLYTNKVSCEKLTRLLSILFIHMINKNAYQNCLAPHIVASTQTVEL